MMARKMNPKRFEEFIRSIADDGEYGGWEYEDGTPMEKDAAAWFASYDAAIARADGLAAERDSARIDADSYRRSVEEMEDELKAAQAEIAVLRGQPEAAGQWWSIAEREPADKARVEVRLFAEWNMSLRLLVTVSISW